MSDTAVTEVLEELIEETIRGVVFDIHRAAKTGILFGVDEQQPQLDESFSSLGCAKQRLQPRPELSMPAASDGATDTTRHRVCAEAGKDVFGVSLVERRAQLFEVKCEICGRVVVHSRFAPHIMKCMGHGRNSKRAASRRITTLAEESHTSEEDDSDLELPPVVKQPRRRGQRGRGAAAGGGGGVVAAFAAGSLRLGTTNSSRASSSHNNSLAAAAGFAVDSDEVEEGCWKELSTPSPSSLSTGSSTGSHKRLR